MLPRKDINWTEQVEWFRSLEEDQQDTLIGLFIQTRNERYDDERHKKLRDQKHRR